MFLASRKTEVPAVRAASMTSNLTLWLNKGLFTENTNPEFALRLNQLDEQISHKR